MKSKILVIGAGAIGGFYGALLARQGADVSVVCRSNYHTVKKNGFAINSPDLGCWNFKPIQVINHPKDYLGDADYVLLCSKVVADINRVELIKEAIKPHTAIVCIQNGIGIEQELQNAFPDNELISGLAFICCNRLKPGVISH
ncbi:MAG: hypothetical protein KAI17_25615, partial [Thiotrichaceae bacterium]|nr:hypothetical protein [Thiotrichaceae bacterium]